MLLSNRWAGRGIGTRLVLETRVMSKRILQAVAVAAALLLVPLPTSIPIGIGTAHADDDGGGDDGGGGGGGRRGSVGARSGGSDNAVRRHRPIDLFNFNPFRFGASRQRRGSRATRASRPSLPERAPNEIVASGLTDADLAALSADGYGVLARQTLASTSRTIVRLSVPNGTSLEAARGRVSGLNAQARVDFNHYYRPRQDADLCQGRNCASLALLDWPSGRIQGCGRLPLIGMIDTGINVDHPALEGQNVELLQLSADRAPSNRQHGTAVAALLVGKADGRAPGLLPDARLIAVDGFQDAGRSDTRMEVYDLVRALDMLSVRDVRVLNLSFTGPDNQLLAEAVAEARKRNAVLVAAAGNAGPRAKPLYPAAYDGVVAVTALDQRMTVYRRAVQGEHIDFAAPGVNIWSAASVSGWRQKSGTSFAAPFVTAAIALALAHEDKSPGEAILESMAKSAKDLGNPGRDPVYGWGLVQAASPCPS